MENILLHMDTFRKSKLKIEFFQLCQGNYPKNKYQNGSNKKSNLREKLSASLVCLQLVDVLHQDALVFEDITLGSQIETVVPGGTEQIYSDHLKTRCFFPS